MPKTEIQWAARVARLGLLDNPTGQLTLTPLPDGVLVAGESPHRYTVQVKLDHPPTAEMLAGLAGATITPAPAAEAGTIHSATVYRAELVHHVGKIRRYAAGKDYWLQERLRYLHWKACDGKLSMQATDGTIAAKTVLPYTTTDGELEGVAYADVLWRVLTMMTGATVTFTQDDAGTSITDGVVTFLPLSPLPYPDTAKVWGPVEGTSHTVNRLRLVRMIDLLGDEAKHSVATLKDGELVLTPWKERDSQGGLHLNAALLRRAAASCNSDTINLVIHPKQGGQWHVIDGQLHITSRTLKERVL